VDKKSTGCIECVSVATINNLQYASSESGKFEVKPNIRGW
jgi:hypothetical protein